MEAKLRELQRVYATALLMGDEIGAEIAIRDAMDAGASTAQIDDAIIAPALWLVGDLWERGEITVADEHIATEISIRVLALQREAERVASRPARAADPAGGARGRAARGRPADARRPPPRVRLRRR